MLSTVRSARVMLRALVFPLPLLAAASACAPAREMPSNSAPEAGLQRDGGAVVELGTSDDAGLVSVIDAAEEEAPSDAGSPSDAGPTEPSDAALDAGPASDAGPADAASALDAAADAASPIELGSGERAFVPVHNGDHVPFIAGPQGGHHVWLSVRERGLGEGLLRMTLDVIPTAPATPSHTEVMLNFLPVNADGGVVDGSVPAPPGTREFTGWTARVDSPECAVSKPLRLEVQLQDTQGKKLEAALEVVPDPVPTLPPTCGM